MKRICVYLKMTVGGRVLPLSKKRPLKSPPVWASTITIFCRSTGSPVLSLNAIVSGMAQFVRVVAGEYAIDGTARLEYRAPHAA